MKRENSNKNFYRHVAQKYQRSFPLRNLLNPDCRTIIPEMDLDDGLRLLDVGCGDGKLLFALAGFLQSCELYGVDISEKKIRKCQKKKKSNSIKFNLAAAEKLPFEDEYFDAITCTNLIHHLPQRVRAIDEMYRVLKPGGILYILEGIHSKSYKQKFDKMLRQTKFIKPQKRYLPQSSIINKSYFIVESKEI